ncbi:MAG: hypothetical protein ACK2TV_14050 [Anaerolineales bacterium]
MKRKTLVTLVIVGLLVAGGVFLALTKNSVQAASDTSRTETAILGAKGGHVDAANLAEALGISVDELTEAKAAAVDQTIDQALELNLITQVQADALKSEESSHRMGLFKLLNNDDIEQLDYDTFLFDALGITEEEYIDAVDAVEQAQLDEAVAEGTITQEEADAIAGQRALLGSSKFSASMKDAYQAAIEEALEDGTITQAQADALLARLENANFGIFHAKMDHFDGHRPGGHPSRMHDDLIPNEGETLDDVDE